MQREIIVPTWGTHQKLDELIMLQEFLKNFKIEKVLEIGTAFGGTAMLWAQIVSPVGGHVYCADKAFGWAHGRPAIYNDDSTYEKCISELKGDSHDSKFIKKVYDIVGEVDLLFIDGDHSYDGVKQDFENYSPLVKKDGYVILHDIVSSDYHRSQGVNVDIFWNEIKSNYLSYEFCKPNGDPRIRPDCMGIGVLKMEKKMVKKQEKLLETIDERHPIIVEKEITKTPKIYDCFMFFNEFDLFEIRLNELKDIVDKFVIVDCNCTHTGKPKDYLLEPLLETRFAEFRDKIEYIKMDISQTPLCDIYHWHLPDVAWGIDATQRNYSMRYLSDVCGNDDIIISGDCDEIPNIEAIKSYKKENGLCSLVARLFYFYFNSMDSSKWGHQKIGTWKDFKKSSFSRM
ncbi:MAG: CmcI family methyltransferase, partial [Candidatus Staskawiczbacteria bacterium]